MDSHTHTLINNTFIFSEISIDIKTSLCKGMQVIPLSQGKHLFHSGDDAKRFYVVKSGEVTLYRFSPEGDEKVFQQVIRGDAIAEAAMFMLPSLYPVSAKAKTDAVVLSFSRNVLLDLCTSNATYALQLLSAMALKLNQAVNRVDQLTLKGANQRLVSYLLDLYKQQGSEWMRLPVAHSVLAGQLNIAPETLSRLFKKMRDDEIISGKGSVVVLLDVDSMCRVVNIPNPFNTNASSTQNGAWGGCCNLTGHWI